VTPVTSRVLLEPNWLSPHCYFKMTVLPLYVTAACQRFHSVIDTSPSAVPSIPIAEVPETTNARASRGKALPDLG
jgi:hypothetical protein